MISRRPTRREAAGAPFFPTRRLGRGAGPTAASARGTSARAFSMGSDNPKGAVAPLSAPARYGRYAAIACVCVVLVVTLLTNPHIDPKRVPVAGAGPRRAGASEGRQGALASMQGVASAVGDLKSKLKNAAVELGDVGALHETTMPRRRPGVPLRAKNAARVLERANYEEVGAKVAFTEKEAFGTVDETGTEETGETDDGRDDDVGDEENDDDDDDDVETGDEAKPEGLYTLAALDMRGEDVDLSYAAGKVSLVTNVASE